MNASRSRPDSRLAEQTALVRDLVPGGSRVFDYPAKDAARPKVYVQEAGGRGPIWRRGFRSIAPADRRQQGQAPQAPSTPAIRSLRPHVSRAVGGNLRCPGFVTDTVGGTTAATPGPPGRLGDVIW